MQFELLQYFKTFSGLVEDNLEFDYGNGVTLRYGCGITLRGQMWYFGGSNAYIRQVSSKAILQIHIIHS